MSDPYYHVRDSIKIDLKKLKTKLQNKNENENPDQLDFKDIYLSFNLLFNDLNDLEICNNSVLNNRNKFSFITDTEFETRKIFVSGTKECLILLKKNVVEIENISIKEQQNSIHKLNKIGRENNDCISTNHYTYVNTNTFEIEEQQDVVPDNMSSILDRLKGEANDIGREIDSHQALLGNLDNGMDKASNQMSVALNKIKNILTKNNDNKNIAVILALLITAIVLLIAIVE